LLTNFNTIISRGFGVYDPVRFGGVSLLIPFPPSVTEWIRMAASLRGAFLQDQNHELYWVASTGDIGHPAAPQIVPRPAGVTQWVDQAVRWRT
jgi:hypothetical protein